MISKSLLHALSQCIANKSKSTYDFGKCRISFGYRNKYLWINGVHVDSQNRGHGYAASALTKFTEAVDSLQILMKLEVVPLDDDTTTTGLVKLYERHGFKIVATDKFKTTMIRPKPVALKTSKAGIQSMSNTKLDLDTLAETVHGIVVTSASNSEYYHPLNDLVNRFQELGSAVLHTINHFKTKTKTPEYLNRFAGQASGIKSQADQIRTKDVLDKFTSVIIRSLSKAVPSTIQIAPDHGDGAGARANSLARYLQTQLHSNGLSASEYISFACQLIKLMAGAFNTKKVEPATATATTTVRDNVNKAQQLDDLVLDVIARRNEQYIFIGKCRLAIGYRSGFVWLYDLNISTVDARNGDVEKALQMLLAVLRRHKLEMHTEVVSMDDEEAFAKQVQFYKEAGLVVVKEDGVHALMRYVPDQLEQGIPGDGVRKEIAMKSMGSLKMLSKRLAVAGVKHTLVHAIAAGPATTSPEGFQEALHHFLVGVEAIWKKYMTEGKVPESQDRKFVVEEGQRYVKVISVYKDNPNMRNIYCFVDKSNGDVLKAAGFKVPAKGARGNVFDEHHGLKRCNWHGPEYNK
jgi:hypothetical protein